MNTLPTKTYAAFVNTSYGRTLSQRARYARFLPEKCSVEEWERLLGKNGNNLHHLEQSMEDAKKFVEAENSLNPCSFSSDEEIILILAGCLHDQAEGHPEIGDIPHGTKTREQKTREKNVLHDIVQEHIKALALNEKDIFYFTRARDAVFGDEGDKLAVAFEAIELTGFIDDALRAFSQLEVLASIENNVDHETDAIKNALRRLVAEVIGSDVIERTIDLSNAFPSLEIYLKKHTSAISKAYAASTIDVFKWYKDVPRSPKLPSERENRITHFYAQKVAWEQWCKDLQI